MRVKEWYALKPNADRTGHRSGIGLGRARESTNMGQAVLNMHNLSGINWMVYFKCKANDLENIKKSYEVWNEIADNGLRLGKWTSLCEIGWRLGEKRVFVGFDSEAGAIAFKMLWPELEIRRNF